MLGTFNKIDKYEIYFFNKLNIKLIYFLNK